MWKWLMAGGAILLLLVIGFLLVMAAKSEREMDLEEAALMKQPGRTGII